MRFFAITGGNEKFTRVPDCLQFRLFPAFSSFRGFTKCCGHSGLGSLDKTAWCFVADRLSKSIDSLSDRFNQTAFLPRRMEPDMDIVRFDGELRSQVFHG